MNYACGNECEHILTLFAVYTYINAYNYQYVIDHATTYT